MKNLSRLLPRVRLAVIGTLLLVGIGAWVTLQIVQKDPERPRSNLPDVGQRVDLPEAQNLALKPGRDRELVEESCTTCHSLAPIVRHDGFAADVWEDEVDKMIKRYGAPIPPENAERIVDYLQEYYAAPPVPARGTSDAPGTG